ncbi:MAG: HEPN domain-containing protein [Candidatus Nanohaloarchaea archaeon]|nr:HEPN domain-containing protein [Candidatus Nanohaloarchaea archaeon]
MEELEEAKRYIELAGESLDKGEPFNPAITNCIMAIIKTTDAVHLRYKNRILKDHSKTAKEFQKLYEEGLIPTDFKGNIDSIRKWVGEEKSRAQYKGADYSKSDARKAHKAAKRLYKKTKNHLK